MAPCQRVEILDSSAFTRLQHDWEALLQRSYDNRLFFTPTFCRIWWEHFRVPEVRILTLRDEDGRLQAVLPLQIAVEGGERILGYVGDWNVFDYMDAAAEKHEAQALLTQLWGCALSDLSWDRITLRHVPSASPSVPALQAAAGEMDIEIAVERDTVCPIAILCSSWDGYLQMLSKKQRHEIRRKLRRAQEGAEWEWRTARTEAELERDLPIFFQQHEASGHDKARFLTPDMRAFFQTLTSVLLRDGTLRLSIFRREGMDIAATLAFMYRGRYLLYNSGYDPAYAAFSPGIAAVAHTMEDAIAEKAVAFDFLSGDEPYKYQFGASNTYTVRADGRR
jgi:CelD/BcsL family acetyltransferase involved in cellulose biosynthesis